MNFEANPERLVFLRARGKIVLNACPGSGKTTVIAQKIIELQKLYSSHEHKYCGIACLSFTNAAKDEISNKYLSLAGEHLKFPHAISTIDSFINIYITLPYYYLLGKESKRPKIIEDAEFLNHVFQGLRHKGINGKQLRFSYPPSSIELEKGGGYSSNGKSPNSTKVDPEVFKEYCKKIKSWQVEKGLITTGDSAFLALYLITKFPKIAHWLSKRFHHIIIDEAQDNSELQHTLIDKLIENGLTNIEFVGDPYQSLYEWREAKPKLFLDKFSDTVNWNALVLTQNRRSVQRVINCFSLLRKTTDPKISSTNTIDRNLPVTVFRYSNDNVPQIVKEYDLLCEKEGFQRNCIVVRGHELKDKMLGKSADQEPWKSDLPYKLITAKNLFDSGDVKSGIKLLRKIYVSLNLPKGDYLQRRELEESIEHSHESNALLLKTLAEIPEFSMTIEKWIPRTENYLKASFGMTTDVSFETKKRGSPKFKKSSLNDSVSTHFKRSYTESNIPITTIHDVKGKTLDSILVFFNENRHKENITFEDVSNELDAFPSEKQRLIYVAMSRPEQLLAMAFPISIQEQAIKKKFGDNVVISPI